MSALSLEAVGLTERGQGVRLALDEEIGIEGRFPISTMGGLKGRGHPVGATGLYPLSRPHCKFVDRRDATRWNMRAWRWRRTSAAAARR